MAPKRKGTLIQKGERQPGRRVTIHADGSATGVSTYEMDKSRILIDSPKIWQRHPEEPSLFVQQIDVEYLENDRARATVQYFGLTANYDSGAARGKGSIELSGDMVETPIQLHPKFSDLAGTPEAPKNNAFWVDKTTGETTKKSANAVFLDFGVGKFCGIKTYMAPYLEVRLNYFSKNSPLLKKPGKIVNGSSIPGFKGAGLAKFMLMGSSVSEIGGVYKVSELYRSGDFMGELYK